MNRIVLLLISFFVVGVLTAQVNPPLKQSNEGARFSIQENDSLNKNDSNKISKNDKATIDLYKIISFENDTTFVDTTLTINKDYKFNYLRKDNFNLLPFPNIGQTYNILSYDFTSKSLMPVFGARARHFNFIEVEDVNE